MLYLLLACLQEPQELKHFSLEQDFLATHRVVVDREPGQYLGHPTTTLLCDGKTLLVVYPKGHGKGAIVCKRSSDGGQSWSGRLPTPESWTTSLETPTLHRITTQAGSERLLLFSGLYPIRSAHSEDEGQTWSELEPIGDYGGIVAMSSFERLANGQYAAFFHDDGRFFTRAGKAEGLFTLYQVFSKDDGLTWGEPQAIWSGSEVHLCEPGSVRSSDGRELTLLLRENRRRSDSCFMQSRNECQSWSEPRELSRALTGDRHVAKYATDGRLLITFRDRAKDSPTDGDWLLWVGHYEDLAAGTPGAYRIRLLDNLSGTDCGYAGLELLADGTFVAVSYGHWLPDEQPYIVALRFRLEELDQLAAAH